MNDDTRSDAMTLAEAFFGRLKADGFIEEYDEAACITAFGIGIELGLRVRDGCVNRLFKAWGD